MGAKSALERKIENKRQEIQELEAKIREATAFLQGMQEAAKLLPRETVAGSSPQMLRPGSEMARTQEFLAKIGRAAHISEIVEAITTEASKPKRESVGSSLASYSRKGEIFKRTAPNTFALIDLDLNGASEEPEDSGPPSDFGDDTGETTPDATDDDDMPF